MKHHEAFAVESFKKTRQTFSNNYFMRYIILLFFIACLGLNVSAQLTYSVVYTDSLSSRLKIAIHLSKEKKGLINFIMPRSVPGAYSVIHYDRFIEDLYAVDNEGKKLLMQKNSDDAPRWYCTDTTKAITRIEYEINLKKMEMRLDPTDASIARSGFAGLLNYSIFGWIEGTEQEPVQCSVQTFDQWPIFTTNQPVEQMAKGLLTFKTDNYYTLADGQLFMGPQFRVKAFKGVVPLFIVSYCQTGNEYLDDYGKQGIMSLNILNNYFGELPFKQYSILLRKALPLEPGSVPPFGMEHLQSSTFFGDTSGLRVQAMTEEEVISTLPTYLHHMGHAFLPLRCYGDTYRPHVKEIPPIIKNIWFNEGFMWFIPFEELKAERWQKLFFNNTYKTHAQIKNMSLQELSQEASLMYAADFRLGKAVYSRGAMMAIEMNNYLKEKTNGKKSMRDVIRYLYNWSKENKRPFTMGEFPVLINKACNVDLSNIYKKWQMPVE